MQLVVYNEYISCMQVKSFTQIKDKLLNKLKDLDPRLSYHNIDHTLDVLIEAQRIAISEKITNKRELYLLKLAALYHDSGFLKIYDGHEEVSCSIFKKDAADFDLTDEEIKFVQNLIMVTKITNVPHTRLEKIIRDADLDYLGRNDFSIISDLLKKELIQLNMITDDSEWDKRQITFLKNHNYHTKSSEDLRGPLKQKNFQSLI